VIDLSTVKTANGQKAAVVLKVLELDYQSTCIDLYKGEHSSDNFLTINPVGRAPVIIDRDVAEPLTVYGTLPIALYLTEKTGRLTPGDIRARAAMYECLGILATDLAAALAGQFTFTTSAPEPFDWGIEYFQNTAHRMLKVMDQSLETNTYLAGNELTIADLLGYPTTANSANRLPDGGVSAYRNIQRWLTELGALPGVQRGMATIED
jgi:GST-like protein